MKSWLRWPGVLLVVLLAGCAQHTGQTVSINSFAAPPAEAVPPPRPNPVHVGPCPYLDNETVEQEGARPVGYASASDHPPNPACFFYGRGGEPQLWVWIYQGLPGVADAIVDTYAPVGTSEMVRLNSWQGGFSKRPTGGVLALSEGDASIVVATPQERIHEKRIAVRVIRALRL